MRPTIEAFIYVFIFTFFSVSGVDCYAMDTENEKHPQLSSPRRIIKGRVIDTNGNPLVGATVKEKSGIQGTITDTDGKFTLSIAVNDTLQISFIGYITQEIILEGKSLFEITLRENA